jgi:hypothetical protein
MLSIEQVRNVNLIVWDAVKVATLPYPVKLDADLVHQL